METENLEQLSKQTQLEKLKEQEVVIPESEQTTTFWKSDEMMKSKRSWKETLRKLFTDSEYADHTQIPQQLNEESMEENKVFLKGRVFGAMDMSKSRKDAKEEYAEKRQTMMLRKRIVDSYEDSADEEQRTIRSDLYESVREDYAKRLKDEIKEKGLTPEQAQKRAEELAAEQELELKTDSEKFLASRDMLALGGVLDRRDRLMLVRGYVKNDDDLKKTYIGKAIEKIRSVDLKLFEYKNDDDLFDKYAEKRAIIDAGFVLQNSLDDYLKAGGCMEDSELADLRARIDFLEQVRFMYTEKEKVFLHPEYMMLQEKDYAKLTNEEVNKKRDELKKKIEEGNTSQNLTSLLDFLTKLADVRAREENKEYVSFKQGQSADEYLELLKAKRLDVDTKQWGLNIKTYTEKNIAYKKYMESIIGSELLPAKGVWKSSGVTDRVPTKFMMVELIYLNRHNMTMEELHEKWNDPEIVAEMKAIWQDVRGKLIGQKEVTKEKELTKEEYGEAYGEDIDTMADILLNMVRGLIKQFSVVDDKANYKQFLGLSSMTSKRLTGVEKNWGKKASLMRTLSTMTTDIYQLSGNDEAVTRKAFEQLSREELKLYREILTYTGNVGLGLTQFDSCISAVGIKEIDDITDEKVAGLTKGPVNSKDDNAAVTYMRFQGVTLIFSQDAKYDSVNMRGVNAMVDKTVIQDGKEVKQRVKAPSDWVMPEGDYVTLDVMDTLGDYMNREPVKKKVERNNAERVSAGKATKAEEIKEQLRSVEMVLGAIHNEFTLKVNENGVIDPE